MKHRGRVEQHEVLVVPKKRKAFCDKFLEQLQRLLAGVGQPEILGASGVVRKPPVHFRDGLEHDGILWSLRSHRSGRFWRAVFFPIADGFAIFRVEIPCAPFGFPIGEHEDAEFLAHPSVVGLHEKAFFALGGFQKLLARRNKLAGRREAEGNSGFGLDLFEGFELGPIIRLHRDQRGGVVFLEMPKKRLAKSRRVADPVMLHLPAMPAQFLGEGPQGGEVEDALDLMGRPRVARFDEEHAIPPDLPRVEGGVLQGELIAKNEQGVFHEGYGK